MGNRADLKTYADAHFTTNGAGEIDGAELRSYANSIADLALIIGEAGDLGVHLEWSGGKLGVKASGITATEIAANAVTTAKILDANVTLAKLADIAQDTILGRAHSAGTGVPTALTATQAKAVLAIAASDVSGLSAFATSTDLSAASGTLAAARIADASLSIAKTSGLQTALDAKELLANKDTDASLAANSDTKYPSQKAVKAYVDGIIAAQDAMVFKGVIDASANPNYPAADKGHTYRISVAGKIGGASGPNVEAGDLIIALADGVSAGNQATVGTSWTIIQTNLDGAVIGPTSVTDGNPTVFDGTSGKLIKQVTFAAFKSSLAIAYADVSGLGTAAQKNTGTSGTTVPLLDGANTFSAQQIISLTGTAAGLIIDTTDAGASLGGNLVLRRSSASPAVSDFLNSFEHHGLSSTGVERVYVRSYAQIVLATNAAENGAWYLDTIRAGTVTNEIFVGGGVQLSNPSGGFKGVGTLNALQLYQNGSLINTSAFTAPDASTLEISGTTLRMKDAGTVYAKIQNLGGCVVMGRSAGTTGVGADIQSTVDGDVLRRASSVLGFGSIATAGITDAAVTLAKMANLAQSTIIGRAAAAGTGVPTALTGAQVKTLLAVVQADISDLTTASNVTFATLTTTGVIASGSHFQAEAGSAMYWNGRSQMYSPSSGVIKFNDGGGTDFNRLQFGGTSSAYPSLQRSGAGFVVRLADDSANTTITALGATITANNSLIVGTGGWTVPGYGHLLTAQNAAYTFVLLDAGSIVRHNSGSAHSYTIPPNSSVAFPIGTQIGFANIGAGNLTIARGAGVACFASGVDTNATFGSTIFGFITKLNTDTWALTEI